MSFIIDSNLKSWISYSEDHGFPIQNLPLSVYSVGHGSKRICSIIGDQIIDLRGLFEAQLLKINEIQNNELAQEYLNALIALGKNVTRSIRKELSHLFTKDASPSIQESCKKHLIPIQDVQLHVPIEIGDYTDFYSSKEHAYNVGVMFRDPANALMPNWLHLPVGYHGRASSIIVSGTPIKRPSGQILPANSEVPVFSQSKQLDFELEMGFVIGKPNELGNPIPIDHATDHIQGLMLFNDWSARDIQKWEYVPLGPFLGKNFASTIAPWLVDLDALEPFKTDGPVQEPKPLTYLAQVGKNNYDIQLEVWLNDTLISKSNTKYLYWSMIQQLAHHAVNGCNMRTGDLCASGTISGPTPESYGSMLELAWKGTKPITLNDGSTRTFLLDGDVLTLKAYAQHDQYRIGFGECSGKVM